MNETTMIRFDPKPNDVVSGLNWHWNKKQAGNLYYYSLVDTYIPRFLQKEAPSHDEFDAMVDDILDAVLYQRHGRFLQLQGCEKGLCMVLTLNECALKVNRALRKKYYDVNVEKRRALAHNDEASFTMCQSTILKRTKGKNISKKRVSSLNTASKMSSERATTKARLSGVNVSSHGTKNGNTTPYRPKPAVPTPFPTRKLWSYEELYQTNAASKGIYGSEQEEIRMRRWLNEHKLPQMVGDVLVSHGARNIADVELLVKSQSHLVESLASLDLWKLEQAISKVAENVAL
jgi:hypothetical protein